MYEGNKIVFINQATGYLTIDILNAFALKFDEVALITGSIRVQEKEPDPKIKVSYIIKYNRGNNFKKAFSWTIGTIQILLLLLTRYRKYEKFYFTIPPTAYLFAPFFQSRFSIAVYDLYPNALNIHGTSEHGIMYRWWMKRNSRIFPQAFKVYTLSEKMKSSIMSQAPNSRVAVIPNWTAFSGLIPVKKEKNQLIINEEMQQKFIIQYSGNIGVTHQVEIIVDVAEMLSNEIKLEFLIIGRGKRTDDILNLILNKKIHNCRVIPFRKDEQLFESLCAADLSVIILDENGIDVSVPSKLYNIMASGRPIMAIAPLNSDVAEIIRLHNIGRTFHKSDLKGMCNFILELTENPDLKLMYGENAHRASLEYTNDNAFKYLEYYMN